MSVRLGAYTESIDAKDAEDAKGRTTVSTQRRRGRRVEARYIEPTRCAKAAKEGRYSTPRRRGREGIRHKGNGASVARGSMSMLWGRVSTATAAPIDLGRLNLDP
jgi:hypothetical protein